MDLTALLLSRLQFAFTISFHIIFPSFTIGLAAWLTVLEALGLATGARPIAWSSSSGSRSSASRSGWASSRAW
jgi:cytochrome bd-type quinol oxidase subunit 1